MLDVIEAALDAPPDRRYVSALAEPVDNCPHLVAWVRELSHTTLGTARGRAQPSNPTHRTNQPRAVIVAQLMSTACYPVLDDTLPEPGTIDAAARTVLTDRQDAWSALREAAADGTMFDGILAHGRDGVEVAGPTTATPQAGGGLAGSRFEVTVHLLTHEPGGS